jgi:cytochrome c553
MKSSRTLLLLAPIFLTLGVYSADVAANWTEHCAKCHGEDGKGQTKMGRKLAIADLSDSKVQAKFTDDEALKAMKDGVKDKDGKVVMKPAENISADEMKALVAYVRGLKK